MPYTIDKLPDAPVIVLVHKAASFTAEMETLVGELTSILDAQPEPVFLVLDIQGLSLGLDDLTIGASAAARGQNALMHHPQVRENVIVSTASFVKLGAAGMRTATFGNVNIRVVDTQEQALAYCRERIAEGTSERSDQAYG